MVANLDLNSCDTIVSVSGDGLLNEIVNGLMAHPQWQRAIKMPVAIVPAGSGNALAKTLGVTNPAYATHVAIKGMLVSNQLRIKCTSLMRQSRSRTRLLTSPRIRSHFLPPVGRKQAMDLIRLRQEGRPDVYAFMGTAFGLVSDVDIESERYDSNSPLHTRMVMETRKENERIREGTR